MKQRLLSLVLALALCLSLAVQAAASGSVTPQQAYEAMIALKDQYPEGMRWTNDNYYAWHGGIYSGGYGCAGFAFMLSDAAFGDLPARRLTGFAFSDIQVGDILRMNRDTHSVIVLETKDDGVVIAEGNFNSSVHWGRTLTKDEVLSSDYALTRYPEEVSEPEPEPAVPAAVEFTDVAATHWAHDAIVKAAENGYVAGYGDGTFRPNNTVTNAEFIVMIARAICGSDYESVMANWGTGGPWYQPAMEWWASHGESEYVRFADPDAWGLTANQPIIRADVAVIGSAFIPGDSSPAGSFSMFEDCAQIEPIYKVCIGYCVLLNELGGYPDGTFRPYGEMTRAEACVVVDRIQRVWQGEQLPSIA